MFLRMVREGKTNEENSTSAFTFCLYDDLDFIRINELSYLSSRNKCRGSNPTP